MGKIILVVIILLLSNVSLFAIDEETYVQFAADSVIAAHKSKGDFKVMKQWADEVKTKYPDFMNPDWKAFEKRLAEDSAFKAALYDKVLANVRSKGYNAHIVNSTGGQTTVEIKD